MTEETNDTPDDPIAGSKWLGTNTGGLLAAIAGIGIALYGMMTGKLGALGNEDERTERQRERLERDRLDFLQKLRAIEREEENHAAHMRMYDATLEREVVTTRYFQEQRKCQEAEQRRHRAEESYWNAKLERELVAVTADKERPDG